MAALPRLSDLPRLVGVQVELLTRLAAAQAAALGTVPATLSNLNRSIRGLADAVNATRESVLAVQRLALRLDGMLDELEQPVRALAPGLTRAARMLDDPTLESLLAGLRDTQERVIAIATATDRLRAIADDAGGRLATLPGAALLARAVRAERTPGTH